jgi:hypothetical protein
MAEITPICSPWQLAADASDRVAELICDIPGWDDYEFAAESGAALLQAAALIQRAERLLEGARKRENRLRKTPA